MSLLGARQSRGLNTGALKLSHRFLWRNSHVTSLNVIGALMYRLTTWTLHFRSPLYRTIEIKLKLFILADDPERRSEHIASAKHWRFAFTHGSSNADSNRLQFTAAVASSLSSGPDAADRCKFPSVPQRDLYFNSLIILDAISSASDVSALESTFVADAQSNRKSYAPTTIIESTAAAANDADHRHESNAIVAQKQSTAAQRPPIVGDDTAAPSPTITAPAVAESREWHHLFERQRDHGAEPKELWRCKFCRKVDSQAQTDESALEQR